MLAAFVILTILQWSGVLSQMPPQKGECSESFMEIYPPQIMNVWHVVQHTDNLMPSGPDCLTIKGARRTSFGSDFRIDATAQIIDKSTNMMQDSLILRADVSGSGSNPFQLSIVGGVGFPPNLMVTDFDEDSECMAAWACQELSGVVQKAGWILCQDLDVDEEVIEDLKQSISEKADIDPSYFVSTKGLDCDV